MAIRVTETFVPPGNYGFLFQCDCGGSDAWKESGLSEEDYIVIGAGEETMRLSLTQDMINKLQGRVSFGFTLDATLGAGSDDFQHEFVKTSDGSPSSLESFKAQLSVGTLLTLQLEDSNGRRTDGIDITVKSPF